MKKKKIKVLVDLERLRYSNSGIANVFKNLAKGLSEIVTKESKSKIDLYGPLTPLKNLNTSFPLIKRESFHKIVPFYSFSYDVLHTSHQLSSYFRFKRFCQKKIVTLHDLNFLHENISEKKYKKELNKVRKNLKNADVIVCISEFVKQDFLSNKSLFSFDKEPKVKVVHNGISFPDTKVNYDLGAFSFLKEKNYVLNIGVLFAKKNQLSLVKMLPYIKEDLVFVVSGENQFYAKEIQIEIQKLELTDRVHFCYHVSDEQKWALIQNCKVMCHPSTAEGFGIPPIEAMCFGKPVFLSKLTSLPEIGGDVAFYFDDFETKNMVASYKRGVELFDASPQKMREQLINRSKEFDYKVMASQYYKIYQSLLIKNN
ncbi:glycosyltransferase involved in cell wall biosynthesis [Wenyingzhuangia heitensis]|uniref:Glycosyltransferase involved in cell wall biosynthesis n=1 Tax=Wenyingzhuangia heitensis TaxID=1487859 RepID=A0ABX0UE27_9FLAO|nr:glycosyltransferase family 1 protein [Wenyingzhuangia heitensis]NIJ45771.1 glycosyltransferase involved in cell wall biosynthesis [Wenyingzhuangia heitensis]